MEGEQAGAQPGSIEADSLPVIRGIRIGSSREKRGSS